VPYTFRCASGHEQGVFLDRPDRKAAREMRRCYCGERARLVGYHLRTTPGVLTLPEIPEHFNRSLGMTISSRKHLEQVQRDKGVCDYSPGGHGDTDSPRSPSTSWQ